MTCLLLRMWSVNYAIRTLKNNKAASHLQHASGRLPVLLTKLFKYLFITYFVLDNFSYC